VKSIIEFNLRKHNDIGIISLKGKLIGPPETQELRKHVESFLEKDIKKIVIDLKNVDWIGSVGLGAITGCVLDAHSAGGGLRLAGLNKKVKRVIDIANLYGVLRIFNSVDQAARSFSNGTRVLE
jgi:stage II sporulation protein AA (anti-sigma F factor antagonist)